VPAPAVSVVIPAYKAAATIRRAVDSVLSQPRCRATVIVVVDGPDPKTEQLLSTYDPQDVRTLVQPVNKGVQAARSRGLNEAADAFVLFLDSDDFIEGDLLGAGLVQMTGQEADLGLARMEVLDEATGHRTPVSLAGATAPQLFMAWLAKNRFVAPCSVLWRTEFLRRIGGWDLDLHRQEDGELVMRALLRGAAVVHLPTGNGVYVQHAAPNRLTARSDNLQSLLDVPEKLLRMDSEVVTSDQRRRAAAMSFANAARTTALRGRWDLAKQAMERARALGGARPCVAGSLGCIYRVLPMRAALGVEAFVRRVAGRPY
jgi:glycosyltransferase involved in cell wall biosynthesis